MAAPQRTTRRMMAPEVVQTSAMDCGPASLKCLLEGFGVPVSYGRLREACQTDVDGTSIDTLEDVAQQLGLDAEQVMLPVDHLLLPGAETLPALVVVTLPSGMTHFVVAWRTVAGFVQVMDPSTGRRWPSRARFLEEVYTHAMPVPAAAWRQFAAGPGFQAALTQRMRALGVGAPRAAALFAEASASPGWQALGALDAATRMVSALVEAGALRAGAHTAGVLAGLAARAKAAADSDGGPVPEGYWSVRPEEDTAEPALRMKGAVLLRVKGLRGPATEADATEAGAPLSPELAAALHEPPVRAGRALWGFLREDGLLTPTALLGAFAATALGAMVEVLLFRGLFELGRYLGLFAQRMMALAALGVFLLTLLLLELPVMAALQRLGRGLDARLRVAFLAKIPRLGDRYFRSRPTSDMAERAHTLHQLRALPDLGARVVQTVLGLVVTTAGIAWLDPQSAPAAAAVALLGVTLPLLTQPLIGERDMRFRVHGGALTRFYLDALQGLMAVRTHGAERALRREHESLLVEWARAGRALQRAVLGVEALQGLASAALTVWLVTRYLDRAGDASGVLLLLFWALSLPAVGQELATLIRQYPAQRNVALRLLEPLGAPDEHGSVTAPVAPLSPRAPDAPAGVSLSLQGVTVRAGGHTILEGVDLAVQPGAHVAVVGPSGAGKSSLVGLLLGWHRAAEGAVLVDGQALDGERLAALRAVTAWVDPAVQLWNRSFLHNLRYGAPEDAPTAMAALLDDADLRGVLQRLPDGLQSVLGEGGGLVSGGEGQRVRLGRAMMRADARLVILDEPFRGLDRDRRRALLGRARARWRSATMLCITHDVSETRQFDRVLVVEGGRVVEDGAPSALAAREGSRYRALLDADGAVRHGLWTDRAWRRLRLDAGRLSEAGEADPAAPPPGGLP
jgi:ABC-type bacteriocin/lantibiotic exporter with double-glycine peptidase domain